MFESITAPTPSNWKVRITIAAVAVALLIALLSFLRMTLMPLSSFRGPLPPVSAAQSELAGRLSGHVRYLSSTIRERNSHHEDSLPQTIIYLRDQLTQMGYTVVEQTYTVSGQPVSNLEGRIAGSDENGETVVVGAHYDSVEGTVGANDNASGVAATLELARMLSATKRRKNIRFVFFINEEPPFFQTSEMGSLVYARQLRRGGVRVSAMLSLETIGYYSEEPGSQKYPPVLGWFYPSRGNFICFVGNPESRSLVRQSIRAFRETTRFPSEGLAAPENLPGVGWSDHWSFWQQGYPAIMITDTALFRYPYYHTANDTADKLDYEKMARVVEGVRNLVESLAGQPQVR